MCLHAKCIQSGSIGSLYIIDEFYNTLTFCIIRLTKIVVIKLYIFGAYWFAYLKALMINSLLLYTCHQLELFP